jgi:glycosyltransferase involved in cell wall biosynthesis
MDNRPIRVLHVLGRTDMGGAENRIMDLYRSIDRNRVQFDFMVHTTERCFFDDEIESLGGHVYRVPRYNAKNHFDYIKAWDLFFEKHPEIEVVHGHMTSTAGIYLPIAKKHGVRLTIAHTRSAGVPQGIKGIMTKVLRKGLYKKVDLCLACSKIAGINSFGKKAFDEGYVKIIPNAIDTARFKFDENMRNGIRQELGIKASTFVVGHVGRFHYAKNHDFLIKVFSEIRKLIADSKLVLVGDGELKVQIAEWIKACGIEDDVILTGTRKNVEDYYQAFDYFVFPSRYEGLPGTVVEAQTSGLRCLISDSVTDEVMITDLTESKSLDDPPLEWAKKIVSNKDYTRASRTEEVRRKGFDSESQIDYYTELYIGGNKEKR